MTKWALRIAALVVAVAADHPVSWLHEFEGGRAWYTGMGHTTCSYSEVRFLDHLQDGILYAAGAH